MVVDSERLRSDTATQIHRIYRLRAAAVTPAAVLPLPPQVARERFAPSDAATSESRDWAGDHTDSS